ncbi:MAG TPA: cation transporter [Methylovirgula sp.]|nr:cation transporter [Methylovirgula sp.]
MKPARSDRGLESTLALVVGLNLSYFGIELAVALAIGSLSLLADSLDFLEDLALNALVLAALRLSPALRARLGMALAGLLILPAAAMLVTLARKFAAPVAPAPLPLSLTGLGALVVNTASALVLARVRDRAGSLTRAAFLSARNDVAANVAIIVAGGVTALWPTIWPDVVVGLGIAVLNADSARDIFQAARREIRRAKGLD